VLRLTEVDVEFQRADPLLRKLIVGFTQGRASTTIGVRSMGRVQARDAGARLLNADDEKFY
jgi:hypothetical protein